MGFQGFLLQKFSLFFYCHNAVEGIGIHKKILIDDANILFVHDSRNILVIELHFLHLPGEYVITVSFRLKEDTIWAERGHEVAFGQAVYTAEAKEEPKKQPKFRVVRSLHDFGVKGENFDVLFSYLNGGLVSYRYGGVEMI